MATHGKPNPEKRQKVAPSEVFSEEDDASQYKLERRGSKAGPARNFLLVHDLKLCNLIQF